MNRSSIRGALIEEKKRLALLWKARKKLVAERKRLRLQQDLQDAPRIFQVAIPCVVAGLVFLVILFPFAVGSAFGTGVDGIDVLLLQKAPGGLPQGFFDNRFPDYSLPSARPILFAFGLLYGAIGIVAGLMFIAGGLPKLVIMANGLYSGYFLTRYLSVDVLGILDIDAFTGKLFDMKIAYIFLVVYLFSSLTNIFSLNEYRKERFGFLFAGLGGLLSGWILGRGFGADAVVFSGVILYITSFFSMWVFEMIAKPVFDMMEISMGEEDWESFSKERCYSFSGLKRLTVNAISSSRSLFFGLFLINLLFPFVGLGAYLLIFT